MSLAEVDWKRHLGPNSLIPADLEIRVVEGDDTKDWVEGNIHMAHKSFMASVSDVFAAQFYGKLAQDKTYTYIENTTMVAVGTFLEFIYSKPKEFSLGSLSIDNLFHVLSLADKFNIFSLVAKVRFAIRNLPLEKSNVMEVAAVAENYLLVFDEVSQRLQKRCAEFLSITMKDFSTCSTFLLNDVEDLDLLKKLLRSVKESRLGEECTHEKIWAQLKFRFEDYLCNKCYNHIPPGIEALSCRTCDYDECRNCSSQD